MLNPKEIENTSFEIITEIMRERNTLNKFDKYQLPIVQRVIHTTGDPDVGESLYFSENFFEHFKKAFENKNVFTDVYMVNSGISRRVFTDINVHTYIKDEDISKKAKETGISRSYWSMDKALNLGNGIFAIGNAPTALRRLLEGKPKFVIGVPVGFVGAVESKDDLIKSGIPCISLPGRRGGSNIAAAIMNGIMKVLKNEMGS